MGRDKKLLKGGLQDNVQNLQLLPAKQLLEYNFARQQKKVEIKRIVNRGLCFQMVCLKKEHFLFQQKLLSLSQPVQK